MGQEELKEIRALRRGIEVMDELCRSGASTLAELQRATRISKSTLRRILLTLEKCNVARRSLVDNRYRANIHLPTHSGSGENPTIARLARAAMPILQSASEEIIWPSDITVREGLFMRFVESNRSMTPLQINRNEVGDKAFVITTAAGRAYLAFCPDDERSELIGQIRLVHGENLVTEFLDKLPQIREQGFATRSEQHKGNTLRNPRIDDKLAAIAMPIVENGLVMCCVSLLWPKKITDDIGGEKTLAEKLKLVAEKIEDRLNSSGEIGLLD